MHIKALQPTARSSVDFCYDFIFTELTVAAVLILAAAEFNVCAGHGTELARWKSSRQVFAEPKARRRARASS